MIVQSFGPTIGEPYRISAGLALVAFFKLAAKGDEIGKRYVILLFDLSGLKH